MKFSKHSLQVNQGACFWMPMIDSLPEKVWGVAFTALWIDTCCLMNTGGLLKCCAVVCVQDNF